MDEKWVEQIRRNLEQKSSEELLQILKEDDREGWTDEAFVAIRHILEARGENPDPPAEKVVHDELAQANLRERPGCVTVFAILMVIGAILYVLGSIVDVFRFAGDEVNLLITLAFLGLYLAVAVGLWQLKNWARIAVIVLQSLEMLLWIDVLFSDIVTVVASSLSHCRTADRRP